MRLLNVNTETFEEFIGNEIPPYAILSHTWELEEVTFKDMETPTRCYQKLGYNKIRMTCKQAANDGLEYAWIDTCCIDKSSSAELSEAINSMFRWYKRSSRCYVFLSDIASWSSWKVGLPHCRWFTRGWTLQELVAPSHIDFFDRQWTFLFSKNELIDKLSSITGIDIGVLEHQIPLRDIPVAQRMSWAADRKTTRVEDTAYCLLGIFDINMPLLYGEQEKAFYRLQEEIIKSLNDLTVFAWTAPPKACGGILGGNLSGLLAPSPLFYRPCGSMELPVTQTAARVSNISSREIAIRAGVLYQPVTKHRESRRLVLPVCATRQGDLMGLHLRVFGQHPSFVRQNCHELILLKVFHWTQIQWNDLNMLPTLPMSNLGDVQWPIHGLEFLGKSRAHLCQISVSDGVETCGTHPGIVRDTEEQAFFLSHQHRDSQGLFCNMEFYIFGPKDTAMKTPLGPVCHLIVLGWDKLDEESMEFTLTSMEDADATDRSRFADDIKMFSIYNYAGIKECLREWGVGRTSSVVYHNATSKDFAVVSAKARVVNDGTLCRSAFWRFEISVEHFPQRPSKRPVYPWR